MPCREVRSKWLRCRRTTPKRASAALNVGREVDRASFITVRKAAWAAKDAAKRCSRAARGDPTRPATTGARSRHGPGLRSPESCTYCVPVLSSPVFSPPPFPFPCILRVAPNDLLVRLNVVIPEGERRSRRARTSVACSGQTRVACRTTLGSMTFVARPRRFSMRITQ